MNKLILDGPQGPLLLCILEPGNIERLKQGEPIEFALTDKTLFKTGIPPKLSIGIAYSETPIADAKELRARVTPGGTFEDTRTPQIEARRPHCPECKSTVEQLGVMRTPQIWLAFCPVCGSSLGATQPGSVEP